MIAVYFLAIIGGLVISVAAVACLFLVRDWFLDWRHEPHSRSFQEGCQHARNRLMNDAWWFSESPETMTLIQELARGVNVSDVREKWRKAREAKPVSQADHAIGTLDSSDTREQPIHAGGRGPLNSAE